VFAERILQRAGGVVALLATMVGGIGCIVEAGDSTPPPVIVEPGRLTVRWTINEGIDPNFCVLGRAAAIDIAVTTSAGASAGEYQAPCANFGTSISSLYPGSYFADALLIDSVGRARTTNVQIAPFTIYARTELVVDVDFPADSFLDGAPNNIADGEHNAAPTTERAAAPNRVSAPPADSASRTSL
jgi:hypothetical protein